MNASFFQGERLSRKQAKKIYTLATVTSVLYLVAKFLLWVGALLIFWHVIWQIPDATVKVIKQYFDYCTENALVINEQALGSLEKAAAFLENLSTKKVGVFQFSALFSGLFNFKALSGETYEKVTFIIYWLQLISFVYFIFSPTCLRFLFKEFKYVKDRFSVLPDGVYGSNYQRNWQKYQNSKWVIAVCNKMLKWISPSVVANRDSNVSKQTLKDERREAKRYIKENKKGFKRERKLFWKNPQTSASLSDAYYYRCTQTTDALWGKDPDDHIVFVDDPITEKALEGEDVRYRRFRKFVDAKKSRKYDAKFNAEVRKRRVREARRKIFLFSFHKVRRNLRNIKTGHYSIAKSYNDTFRNSLKVALLTIIPLFAAYLGLINALAPIKLPVLKWFCFELGGLWYFALLGLGLLFYFILGIMAGRVLNIERVERDEYYRNLKEIKREGKNVFLKEVGRIRKNTTMKRSALRRIPREFGITVFTFRNICQIFAVSIMYILMISIIKTEMTMYIKSLSDTANAEISLVYLILKCIAIAWMFYRFNLAFNYALSANEFRISTMREDRRKKARVKYRRSMRFLTFAAAILLVVAILVGGAATTYFVVLGAMMLIGFIAATSDWLLRPRDPDEDVGVDFFFDDGNKRDPDDGVYVS